MTVLCIGNWQYGITSIILPTIIIDYYCSTILTCGNEAERPPDFQWYWYWPYYSGHYSMKYYSIVLLCVLFYSKWWWKFWWREDLRKADCGGRLVRRPWPDDNVKLSIDCRPVKLAGGHSSNEQTKLLVIQCFPDLLPVSDSGWNIIKLLNLTWRRRTDM